MVESVTTQPPHNLSVSTTESIRSCFREHVETPIHWLAVPSTTSEPPIPQGNEEGFLAQCDEIPGRLFYVKPTRMCNKTDEAPAAREKIASDLAFELGLPVPPVILGTRDVWGQNKEVCASLFVVKKGYPWPLIQYNLENDPEGPISKALTPSLPIVASQMLVFDAWLAQVDHGGHEPYGGSHRCPNIIADQAFDPPYHFMLSFIDYSMSLGCEDKWPPRFRRNHFPTYLLQQTQKTLVEEMIEQIQQIENQTIVDIVKRVPSQFLGEDEGDTILEKLLRRKDSLDDILVDVMKGED